MTTKTIDERVDEFDKYLGGGNKKTLLVAEFRRLLIAHGEQVREEERERCKQEVAKFVSALAWGDSSEDETELMDMVMDKKMKAKGGDDGER